MIKLNKQSCSRLTRQKLKKLFSWHKHELLRLTFLSSDWWVCDARAYNSVHGTVRLWTRREPQTQLSLSIISNGLCPTRRSHLIHYINKLDTQPTCVCLDVRLTISPVRNLSMGGTKRDKLNNYISKQAGAIMKIEWMYHTSWSLNLVAIILFYMSFVPKSWNIEIVDRR